jgi:hypothetical protein
MDAARHFDDEPPTKLLPVYRSNMLTDAALREFLTHPVLEVRDMAWELLAAREVVRAAEPVLRDYNQAIMLAAEAKFLEPQEADSSRDTAGTLKKALAEHRGRTG